MLIPNNGCEPKQNEAFSGLDFSNAIAFLDFDNTITTFDVLDDIITHFAINQNWATLEQAWQEGKIGSKECLEGQLKSIRVTKPVLSQYLTKVKLDPSFNKLRLHLKSRKIETVIVSDSFYFIIDEILKHNGITKIKILANEIDFDQDRLIPSFPFFSSDCPRCAHCKKKHLLENPDKTTIYIGDGLSDICPAECADLVFAKSGLLNYLKQQNRRCIPIENLGGVYAFFERFLPAGKKTKEIFVTT